MGGKRLRLTGVKQYRALTIYVDNDWRPMANFADFFLDNLYGVYITAGVMFLLLWRILWV